MSEVIKSAGEQQEPVGSASEWDILRPENNGLGDFDELEAKQSKKLGIERPNVAGVEGAKAVKPETSSIAERQKSSFEPDEWTLKILDDDWTPEWDHKYQNIPFPEMYQTLERRVELLESVVSTMDDPNNYIDLKEAYQHEYESSRKLYTSLIERIKNGESLLGPPEVLLRNTRANLVEARFCAQAMENPKETLANLKEDFATLEELAQEQVKTNFRKINRFHLHQENAQILNQIPVKQLRELAKQMNGENFQEFDQNLKTTLTTALGIDINRIAFYAVRSESYTSQGSCSTPTNQGGNPKTVLGPNDKIRILLNYTKLVDAGYLNAYANTVAHELKHAQQYLRALENPMSDYWTGEALYKDGEDKNRDNDYTAYRNQKIEWDAFDFGDNFQRRLQLAAPDQQIKYTLRKLDPRRWFKKTKQEILE